jgi:hypothetical protein
MFLRLGVEGGTLWRPRYDGGHHDDCVCMINERVLCFVVVVVEAEMGAAICHRSEIIY